MGSVWFKQVDKALIESVNQNIYYLDSEDNQISLPCFVRLPDTEIKVESFPCATLYPFLVKADPQRMLERSKVVVSKDIENGIAEVEKRIKAYNLFYQIDFWAKYYEDIQLITMLWANLYSKFNTLSVIDTDDNNRICHMIEFPNSGEVMDTVRQDNERILRRTFSYMIKVEVDENISEEVKIVTNREVVNTISQNIITSDGDSLEVIKLVWIFDPTIFNPSYSYIWDDTEPWFDSRVWKE